MNWRIAYDGPGEGEFHAEFGKALALKVKGNR
jgi:hypothetical protein